uniref:FAM234A/B beta-propeller domain-containing protein n=1 Tax=Periophthalmus magnuspinnatus TaxID=409849 RepID=A0A3B4A499_9GOBI
PLTQADSEDESEEDDLVLSYPRNGLGRDGCLGPGGGSGRSGRFVGAVDEMLDEEDEDDDWREMKHMVRTAAFLVPLVCATLLVLLCAFLIPCQKGKVRPQWERAFGEETKVIQSKRVICVSVFVFPCCSVVVYSAAALSAVNGQVIWKKPTSERVMYIQCGLRISAQKSHVCLLISKSTLTAVNGTTGEIRIRIHLLPSFYCQINNPFLGKKDSIITLCTTMDLSFTLISGQTGAKLGRSVPFNISGQGKLIGPLLHKTQQEAFYILFGLGNIKAISLCDLYIHATGKMPSNQELRKRDPGWEGLKARTNSSTLIHIFGYASVNEIKLWLLWSGTGDTKGLFKVFCWQERAFVRVWESGRQPTSGHFNDDGVLDIFLQHSANGVMKVQIIDGAKGRLLWSAEFACPRLDLGSTTMSTSSGQSVFLFWASEPIRAQKNVTKTTVSQSVPPGAAAGQPLIRKLFLLHPLYPTVLLELNSTTDTAVTSAVIFDERQDDASYITVSSQPTPGSRPIVCVVKIMSLKAAIVKAKMVRLNENRMQESSVKPSTSEVSTFFRRLAFKH